MIIRGDVAAARGGFPRRIVRRRVLAIAAGVVVVILAILALLRDEIERTALTWRCHALTGGEATIGALHHEHGGTVLDRVRFVSADRAVTVEARRLALRTAGGVVDVGATSPHVTIALDGIQAGDLAAARSVVAALGGNGVGATLAAGTLTLVRSVRAEPLDAAPSIVLDDVHGSLALTPARTRADLALNVAGGTQHYPVSVRSVEADLPNGGVEITADTLPLATLAALLPSSGIAFDGGMLRRVDVIAGPAVRGRFTLEGASARLEGNAIGAIHGEVAIASNGIGSQLLGGTLNGVPLELRGEIDDVRDWAAFPKEGTRDARALVRMVTSIAEQPNLKWVNVDTTAPGVTFGQYAMTAKDPILKHPETSADIPHVVQLIAVDPHEPTLRFDTAIASDHVISSGERTSQLGIRTHAVAGVNGDYFDIGRTYEPQGMLIRSGTLVRGPTDRMALVIDRAGKVTFAEFHLNGHARYGGRDVPVTQLNTWPAGDATVITRDYGTVLRPAPGVTFAALAPLGGDRYRVTSVRDADRELAVTFGLALGPKLKALPPKPGTTIRLQYALDPAVPDLVTGIGGGPLLLKNGEWYDDKHAPAPDERDVQWPVVALGTRADQTLLFVAVDGRHPERSIGMTRPEFAEMLKRFGVTDAMALDSGGSVTMVSRAPGNADVTVRNVPSDNSAERYISDALFVYSSAPAGTIVTSPAPSPAPTSPPIR
ncbi:phosphodiester glycosidase family protein [Vulcanimicrobium alpinum]|uniref:phosphodiester glycosidase family protein n=1 Tax=Vulcanimicrobium alpinum TaxID=3016050 RepID=UPI00295F4946|nr:phosphodiester glycosidase family protein [Vulcanimicrobium alpinum]